MTVRELIERLKECDPDAMILLIGEVADDGRAEALRPTTVAGVTNAQ